jgi:hydroxyacylglutathione hydrolase
MKLAPLPAFDDNDIRMLQDGRNAIVVVPEDAAPVFDAPARCNLQLAAILGSDDSSPVTHHDANHRGALRPWKNDFR